MLYSMLSAGKDISCSQDMGLIWIDNLDILISWIRNSPGRYNRGYIST